MTSTNAASVGSLVRFPGKIGSLSRGGNVRRKLIRATRTFLSDPLPNKDELVIKRLIARLARSIAVGRPVELGRTSERQCVGSILELRLQAHISGPVERQDGNADDDDQHQRHIGKNDAVRVAPERFNRLLRSLRPPYSQQ